MLDKTFSSRQPFKLRQLPLLARFYQRAFHTAPGQMASWFSRFLRLAFPMCYRVWPSSVGQFEYARLGKDFVVRFDARNLQFQSLYLYLPFQNYEPEVAILVDALLPEAGVFFDVGSNWGYFSLYAASNHEHLTVHAFEPMPDTFRDLTSCVAQAGISPLVTCHQLALSSADGEASIQIPDRLHSGQATVSLGCGKKRIVTRRLDAMNLPAPNLIKMDAEEHEIEVLRGSEQTLRSAKPFIVFENKPNDSSPERALEPLFFLKELGYSLFLPVLKRVSGGQPYCMPIGSREPRRDDSLLLTRLEPETRLLWQRDLNLLACPKDRMSEVREYFNLDSDIR